MVGVRRDCTVQKLGTTSENIENNMETLKPYLFLYYFDKKVKHGINILLIPCFTSGKDLHVIAT
jgi:hypothetical protein